MLDIRNKLLDLADETWAQAWAVDDVPVPYDSPEYLALVVSQIEKDLTQSAISRKLAAELLAELSLRRWIEAYSPDASE